MAASRCLAVARTVVGETERAPTLALKLHCHLFLEIKWSQVSGSVRRWMSTHPPRLLWMTLQWVGQLRLCLDPGAKL
jgi:hypothetical protein